MPVVLSREEVAYVLDHLHGVTMIYVLNRGALGVRSPADALPV